MKLARTTLYVICSNDLGRSGLAQRRQSRAQKSRVIENRRPQVRPAARWRMSPKTQRLECFWVLGGQSQKAKYVVA